jgi:hypothetical protein
LDLAAMELEVGREFLAQIDCRLQVIENKAANFPASGKRNWARLIFLTSVPPGDAVGGRSRLR